MINVVLKGSCRSVGGLLDLSRVEFLVDRFALRQIFIWVFLLSVIVIPLFQQGDKRVKPVDLPPEGQM